MARESGLIRRLLEKMATMTMDQEFTEVDMNDLNTLKQSVLACQRQIGQYMAQQPTELFATPRLQVLQSDIAQPRASPSREPSGRRHPSRLVKRGRTMRDKRRRSDHWGA